MIVVVKKYAHLLKDTFFAWQADKAPRLGAALSFYSIFSLGPLLLLLLAAAGFLFGHDAAQGRIIEQIDGMVGQEGAAAVQQMIKASSDQKEGLWATIIGIATLLIGASGLFGQLQEALNTIWDVKPVEKDGKKISFFSKILDFIKHRFLSFTMVLGTGFLLMTSLALSALLSAFSTTINNYAADNLPVGLVNMDFSTLGTDQFCFKFWRHHSFICIDL